LLAQNGDTGLMMVTVEPYYMEAFTEIMYSFEFNMRH